MAAAVSSSWSGSSSLTTPHTITVGGLPVHVYGLPALTVPATSSAGLAVVFVLHGRTESHEHPSIMGIVNRLVESARERRLAPDGKGAKDLLVVTFDQRNHGHRTVDRDRNLGWMEGGRKRAQVRKDKGMQAHELDNVSHATDMLACQVGTSRDVSFLIDFLPPALFPHDERTVTDWYSVGFSLGGHATWLALAHEPRITLGVPIVGSPSTHTLLTNRAANLPAPAGPLPLSAPYFPRTLMSLFDALDPDRTTRDRWTGKKICVLSGADDHLVDYYKGGSDKFVEKLRECGVEVDAWVQPNTGHACTPEMIERICDFIWRRGLSPEKGKL
ncbi:hypothetical protein NBRC10512v2_007605 [Rhodotorula toruloides]